MFRLAARRVRTTVLVVLALLFSQLALANYVCPSGERAQSDSSPAMVMADGQPCEGMAMMPTDTDQPVLCYQHCVNAPQSFEPAQIPTLSLPAVVQVLVVPLVLDLQVSEAVATSDAGEARPPPDPLFLSTLRLRV
ncbi:hypothetical protein [Variovorax soli]|uniref:DUF2946 domain-containing protein n=1 Tax=Variovorax soli TaxID=376815 RepID=A0ABU1NGE5_9BURK|nr:hypothetical protein [Variovorax soli]MDR6537534.1 hypothetical protein [Variovorax soli]